MKKIILLFGLIIGFVYVQAQDFSIPVKETYKEYAGVAGDTVTGATTLSKTMLINKDYLYYYEVLVDVDTVSGGGGNSVSCILYGSNDNVNYSSITDVTYSASADTIIRYTNLAATGIMWRYLKLALTGDGSSAAVELQAIKVKIVQIP